MPTPMHFPIRCKVALAPIVFGLVVGLAGLPGGAHGHQNRVLQLSAAGTVIGLPEEYEPVSIKVVRFGSIADSLTITHSQTWDFALLLAEATKALAALSSTAVAIGTVRPLLGIRQLVHHLEGWQARQAYQLPAPGFDAPFDRPFWCAPIRGRPH